MSYRPFGVALLLAAVSLVVVSEEAQAQKEKRGGAAPIDSAKLPTGEYVGVLRAVPGADRVFTISVENTRVVPVGVSGRRINYRATKTKQEIEFQASAKVKVRTLVLPEQYDDKGRPKKYTAKQLAELKGKDRGLIGYESSLERLEPGMVVRVILTAAPVKPSAKAKDKDVPEDAAPQKRLQASMIVIIRDAGGGPAEPPRKKKT